MFSPHIFLSALTLGADNWFELSSSNGPSKGALYAMSFLNSPEDSGPGTSLTVGQLPAPKVSNFLGEVGQAGDEKETFAREEGGLHYLPVKPGLCCAQSSVFDL